MMGRRSLPVAALGLLGALSVCSRVYADGQVFLTSTRPSSLSGSRAVLPESVARLLTVLGDGERLSRITRARVSDELALGHVRELASALDAEGRVLLAGGDGHAVDRALLRFDGVGGVEGGLRELDVVLTSSRPRALYEAVVVRAQRDHGAARWRSDEGEHPAALWCLPSSATHPAWSLYVSLEGGEPSVRVTRESQDCSAL